MVAVSATATATNISVDKLEDPPKEQDPNEKEAMDHMDATVEVSTSITEVASPTQKGPITPDEAVNTILEVHADTVENKSLKLPADEHAKKDASLEVSASAMEAACPIPEDESGKLPDGSSDSICEILEKKVSEESGKLLADEHVRDDPSLDTSNPTTEVTVSTVEDCTSEQAKQNAPIDCSVSTIDNLFEVAENTISEALMDTSENESGELPTDEQAKQNGPIKVSMSTIDNLFEGAETTIPEVQINTSVNESGELPSDEQEKQNAPIEVSVSNTVSEVPRDISESELGKLPNDEAKQNASTEVLILTTEVPHPTTGDSSSPNDLSDAAQAITSDVSGNESGELPGNEDAKENAFIGISITTTEAAVASDNLSGVGNIIPEVHPETLGNESTELICDDHAKENAATVGNIISEVLPETLGNESMELLHNERAKEDAATVEASISTTEVGLSQAESHMSEEEIPGAHECNNDIKDKDVDSKPESAEGPNVLEESTNRDEEV